MIADPRADIAWDHPRPHVVEVTVDAGDIDFMGHANNIVYLRWLEQVAWSHSQNHGVDWRTFERLGRGMVARRHEIDYLRPVFAGDRLAVATWITNPARAGFDRRYQIVRMEDRRTVTRARTHWACVDMASGRPVRLPPEFRRAYEPTA